MGTSVAISGRWYKPEGGNRLGRSKRNSRPAPGLLQAFNTSLHGIQRFSHVLKEVPAFGGELDRSVAAAKQPRAQVFFEELHLPANGGLTQVKPLCCRGESAEAGRCFEGNEIIQRG